MEQKFNTTLDTENGTLKIDVMQLIDSLDVEQKKELVEQCGWWAFIDEAMANDIMTEFSRDHFNTIYTSLREKLLTGEAMPLVIKEWAVSMIESRESAKAAEDYWNNAYWKLYHRMRDNFESRLQDYGATFNRIAPALPDRNFGKQYSPEFMAEIYANVEKWKDNFPSKNDNAEEF